MIFTFMIVMNSWWFMMIVWFLCIYTDFVICITYSMTQLCHLRQSWSLAKRLRSLRNQGRWEEVSHRVTFAMFLRSMGKFEVSATKKTRHTFKLLVVLNKILFTGRWYVWTYFKVYIPCHFPMWLWRQTWRSPFPGHPALARCWRAGSGSM